MKQFILMLSLFISSASCFATVNYDRDTGVLVMRDVVVDENTIYDNVTLRLNLANGTFSVLDATLKDTSFSATPLDTFSESGLKIDFYGCTLSGKNQITCLTKIVALNQNSSISARGGSSSKLFDNLSNEYRVSTVTALDKAGSSSVSFNLIQGVPVEVKFIYNNINPSATSIPLFEPAFLTDGTRVEGSFTDIDF